MTPEEIVRVDSVIKGQVTPIQNNTISNNNNKPSKGEENERTDD